MVLIWEEEALLNNHDKVGLMTVGGLRDRLRTYRKFKTFKFPQIP